MIRTASTPAQRALRRRLIVSTALVSALGSAAPGLAQVLPTAASVASQSISAEIGAKIANVSNPVAIALQVDLKANATIINWNGFNVPVTNTATFSDTRGAGATGAISVLNRDIGSVGPPIVLSPSVIAGSLTSDQNVSVFIINTAGVLFSSTAAVKVGGLVASGIDIADGNFLNPVGGYAFKTSAGTGTVTVQSGASLTASSTLAPGSIALIGAAIDSRGTLSATGDVGIVAATDVNVVLAAGSPLSVTINEGTPLAAPIVAQGTIGGRNVLFAAATYTTLLSALLDVEATVTATTAASTDHGVVLIAGQNADTSPLVAFTAASNNNGVIKTKLGGSLNATGPGGGVTLLTSAGIDKPAVAATATLSAAAGVDVHAATSDIVLASADAGAGAGVFRADAGNIQLESASGNGITLTGNSIGAAASGRTALTSTGGVDVTVTNAAKLGAVTAGDHATVSAGSIDATSIIVSGGALSATATSGDIGLGTGSGSTGATLRALSGQIVTTQLAGGSGIVDGKAQSLNIGSVTDGQLTLVSTLTTLTLGGGTAETTKLVAATDLAVTGTLAVTGGATLGASGKFTGGSVTATGSLKLNANGAVVATGLSGDGGLTVKGASVNVGTIATVSAIADISTSSGPVTIGGGSVQAATIASATDLAVTNTLSGTGPMLLSAAGTLTGGTVISTGSTLGVSATGAITATSLVGSTGLTVSGSTLALGNAATTSNNVLLTTTTSGLTLGTATSGGLLALNSATTAAVTGAVTAGSDYKITATAVTLGDGTPVPQSAAGMVDITASGGGITGLANLTLRSDSGGTGGHSLVLDASGGIGFDPTSALQGGPAQQSGVGVRQSPSGVPLVLGSVGALRLGTVDAGHTVIGQLTNNGAITLGGPVAVTHSLTVASITGTITTGAVAVTGAAQSLSLNSGIASDIVASGLLSATGAVVLAADRNLTVGDIRSFGSNVSATAVDALAAGTITAAGSIVATAGTATVGGLVSGADAAALDRSASITAGSINVGAVNIGTDLILKATAGALLLGGGSAGNSATLTQLGAAGPLTISGSLDVGTAAGSSGAVLLTTATDARIFALRSLTGDLTLTVPGALTGLPDGVGGFAGALMSAPAAGHDVTVNAGGSVILAALTAGRDVAINTTGTAALTGAVAAGRDYSVAGTSVTLGAGGVVDQHAGGTVTIVSSSGGIVGRGQLTLTSDSGGLGGRDLILRSNASLALGGSALFGGPARTSSIRLGAAPGAAIALGQIDALRLVSYDAALSATALDSSGEVSAGHVTTTADLIIGSTLAGRPANLTLGAATSLNGAVALAAVGFIAGPVIGEAQFANAVDLTAATSVTTRSSSAELGLVTAGSFIDLRTTGDLDLDTSNAGTTTTLAVGGNLRLFSATGAGDFSVTAGGDFSGFATGPASFDRAALTSTGGAIVVTENGTPATTGLVLLGAVQAVTGLTVIGRQLDVSSAAVSAGPIVMQARELSRANLVSLTLGTATASGDIALSSATGTGVTPAVGNGSVSAGSVTSTGGNIGVTAATALVATGLTAANAVTISAGTAQVATIGAGTVTTTSTGDSQFTDITSTGAVALTAGGALAFHGVTSSASGATLTAANAITGTTVGAAQVALIGGGSVMLGTATAGTALTVQTGGDLVLTSGNAGTTAALTSGGNSRLGSANSVGNLTLISSGDVTGLGGESGFGRTILTSTGGAVAVTANGVPATTGLVLLDAVNAATGISVIGRQLDVTSATVTSGKIMLQSRELLPANLVSLTLGTATASGDIALSSASGTGATPATGNDAVVVGNVTSTSGSIGVTGGSLTTATLVAGTTVTATSIGDSQFTGVTGAGVVALTAGGAMNFETVTSTGDAVSLTAGAMTGGAVNAATAVTVSAISAALGTVAAGTALTAHTSGDLVLTTATAGTTIGLTSGGNLRLGSASSASDLMLTSGGDITGLGGDSGFGRAVLTSTGGAVAVTATGVPATTELVLLGAVQAATGLTAIGRQLDVSSAVASAGPIVIQARELSPADLVSLTLGTATASGDINLSSAAGSGPAALPGNGSVSAGNVTSTGGVIGITAATALVATSLQAASAVTLSAGTVAVATIGAGSVTTTSIGDSQFAAVTSTGAVALTAGGALAFHGIISSANGVMLTAATAINGTTVSAAQATLISGGSAQLGTVMAGSALTVQTAGDLILTTATAGTTTILTSGGSLRLGSASSAGNLMLMSGGDITGLGGDGGFGRAVLTSTGGAVAVTATGVPATTGLVLLGAVRAATGLTAIGRQLDVSSAVASAGPIVMQARELSPATLVSLTLGTATASGDITLTSTAGSGAGPLTGNGGLTAGSVTSSAGAIGLTAAGPVSSGPLSAALAVHGRGASFALTTIGAGTTLDLASSAGGIGFTSATSGGDAMLVAAAGGVTGTSLTSLGGAATLTATGIIDLASLTAAHTVTVAAGPLARLSTVTVGGALTVSAAQVALGTATAGSLSLSAGSGGAAIGTVTTSGDIALKSSADITITAATSTAGGFAATAMAMFGAGSITAAKIIAATGASIGIDTASAGSATALTATSGSARLGTATTGGDATVTAATGVALTGALTVGGNLTATGTMVDLAATGSATQAAAGATAITATGGAITGGTGLTLTSGSNGSGKALTLKALAANGSIVFGPASIIAGGTAAAGADVALAATGLVQLGAVTAAGHMITLSASDATLAADLRAAKISLADSGTAGVRIGDNPAGNSAEFGAVPAGHFDLSSAEIAHLSTATLLIDARNQNVVIGDLAVGAATGSTGLAVQTLGRIDLLGRLVASGTVVGRTLVFGGDGSATGLASVIRIAATPGGGGRLIADGAVVTLRGDRIGAGYDANLLTPLALTPAGGTPLTTADVATRFIAQPNGALYAANFNGQPLYTDPVLVRGATLAVDFSRYALFQNTGLAGFSTGIVVGTPGNSSLPAALQLAANDAAVPNGVAIFGTVNGIGGIATALLGPNGIAVGSGVSRANARANGCLIGATSGGCLASSLAQPGLVLFESRAEILRTSDSLTLPFDPLVGTSNEALFSDIVGIDAAADAAECAAGNRPCEDRRKPK